MKIKPLITLDEFFNYTQYPSLSFSPTGKHLLIHTKHPLWELDTYENSLWLYETQSQRKTLITRELSQAFKPQWSPSGNWIVLSINENQRINANNNSYHHFYRYLTESNGQNIYLFSIQLNRLFPIRIGNNMPSAIVWSNNDSTLYFTAFRSWSTIEEDRLHYAEWKDVIQYRKVKPKQGSTIYRIDIEMKNEIPSTKICKIKNLCFLIIELLYAPVQHKLLLTSAEETLEKLEKFEVYSLDMQNRSSLVQLTHNEALEQDLQLSNDGKHVLFQVFTLNSNNGKFNNTQQRLFSVDLTTGHMKRIGKDFNGMIAGYATTSNDNIYILGQLGTEIQIYSQNSSMKNLIKHRGWNGTYELIAASKSFNQKCSIAIIHSSLKRPKEVYCIDNINQLKSARAITNENKLLKQRSLPKPKIYRWKSNDDNRTIEGLLHYPPRQTEGKILPLLVLIHGGPYDASLNHWQGNGYFWAPLAASNGWLVLEPNYRGSTGYGDEFLNELRYQPLTRPGKDILSAVDCLINNGIADPNKLAIGGYSFGGMLTNWLITQTPRFNAALSGTGVADHVSTWGAMDMPVSLSYLMGGFPWEIPDLYQNTGPMYFLDKVRTPTHIVTGAQDVRVPPEQSYMLERGLHNLGIPTQLLIFPSEGHSVINPRKPSYGKIKVREELKWLKQYGHQSWIKNKQNN